MRLKVQNFSCENEFYLHETEFFFIIFLLIYFFFNIYGFIRTSPGFETEAWGYSEMAYSLSRLRLKRNNSVSITVSPSNST